MSALLSQLLAASLRHLDQAKPDLMLSPFTSVRNECVRDMDDQALDHSSNDGSDAPSANTPNTGPNSCL
jgi:hypothetical protein